MVSKGRTDRFGLLHSSGHCRPAAKRNSYSEPLRPVRMTRKAASFASASALTSRNASPGGANAGLVTRPDSTPLRKKPVAGRANPTSRFSATRRHRRRVVTRSAISVAHPQGHLAAIAADAGRHDDLVAGRRGRESMAQQDRHHFGKRRGIGRHRAKHRQQGGANDDPCCAGVETGVVRRRR